MKGITHNKESEMMQNEIDAHEAKAAEMERLAAAYKGATDPRERGRLRRELRAAEVAYQEAFNTQVQ